LVNPAAGKAAPAAVKRSSAEKEARVASKRRERNKAASSQVKTDVSSAEKLIFAGDVEGARKAAIAAVSALDKAAGKKVLHHNNASRRKSRLLKKLAKAKPQAPAEKKA
jgi:small subunit ribosomal protein S20